MHSERRILQEKKNFSCTVKESSTNISVRFQRFIPFWTGNTDRYVPINIFFTELSHQSFMHSHNFMSTIIYIVFIRL